jgi:hypothetical protein
MSRSMSEINGEEEKSRGRVCPTSSSGASWPTRMFMAA